jgi:hypothetical protein
MPERSRTPPRASSAPAKPGSRKGRPGIVHTSLYLPEGLYEALRVAAFKERCKMHDICSKGLNWPSGSGGGGSDSKRRRAPNGVPGSTYVAEGGHFFGSTIDGARDPPRYSSAVPFTSSSRAGIKVTIRGSVLNLGAKSVVVVRNPFDAPSP